MAHSPRSHAWLKRGPLLLQRLDRLVEAGRLTKVEAARLRAAADAGELEEAARAIQLRHARARVDDAVEKGEVTRDEADVLLDRLDRGEDPRILRGLRRRLGRGQG